MKRKFRKSKKKNQNINRQYITEILTGNKYTDDYFLDIILHTKTFSAYPPAFTDKEYIEAYIKEYGEESYLEIKNNPESTMKKYPHLITPIKNE